MNLPPIAPDVTAERVRTHLPGQLAQALLSDPQWENVAHKLSQEHGHDLVDLGDSLHAFSNRLHRHPETHTWATQGAHSPARWLLNNLTG